MPWTSISPRVPKDITLIRAKSQTMRIRKSPMNRWIYTSLDGPRLLFSAKGPAAPRLLFHSRARPATTPPLSLRPTNSNRREKKNASPRTITRLFQATLGWMHDRNEIQTGQRPQGKVAGNDAGRKNGRPKKIHARCPRLWWQSSPSRTWPAENGHIYNALRVMTFFLFFQRNCFKCRDTLISLFPLGYHDSVSSMRSRTLWSCATVSLVTGEVRLTDLHEDEAPSRQPRANQIRAFLHFCGELYSAKCVIMRMFGCTIIVARHTKICEKIGSMKTSGSCIRCSSFRKKSFQFCCQM